MWLGGHDDGELAASQTTSKHCLGRLRFDSIRCSHEQYVMYPISILPWNLPTFLEQFSKRFCRNEKRTLWKPPNLDRSTASLARWLAAVVAALPRRYRGGRLQKGFSSSQQLRLEAQVIYSSTSHYQP